MKVDHHPHISLAETNGIIFSVKELYDFDLGIFSLASLQLMISTYIYEKGIMQPAALIRKLNENPNIFEDLLYWLDGAGSEMFRNPDSWVIINTKILPELLRGDKKPKIWFPSCSSGEELYSFSILAREYGYRERIELSASTMSKLRLKEAESGLFRGNSMDISRENYHRAGGKIEVEYYIEKIDKYIVRKKEIRKNIDFSLQSAIPEMLPQAVNLILFKNRLICYSPEARLRVLKALVASLVPGGYLVLGYMEKIYEKEILSGLSMVSEDEKIYRAR